MVNSEQKLDHTSTKHSPTHTISNHASTKHSLTHAYKFKRTRVTDRKENAFTVYASNRNRTVESDRHPWYNYENTSWDFLILFIFCILDSRRVQHLKQKKKNENYEHCLHMYSILESNTHQNLMQIAFFFFLKKNKVTLHQSTFRLNIKKNLLISVTVNHNG